MAMLSFRALLALVPAALAVVLPRQGRAMEGQPIFTFEKGWIENMALRPNGHLLITPASTHMNPVTSKMAKVLDLPDDTAGGGLVQMGGDETDVWAIIGGGYSTSAGNTPGSWTVWSVDLSGDEPKAKKVNTVKESNQLNGMTVMDDGDTLLLGDLTAGSVYKLSYSSGEYKLLKEDKTMAPGTPLPFGIDGMKFRDRYLYFTNIGTNSFHRMPISAEGIPGDVETIFNNSPGDDFAFDEVGNAFIATNIAGTIIKVAPNGATEVVADVQRGTCVVLVGNVLYAGTAAGAIVRLDL
jgi:hypothetical protein